MLNKTVSKKPELNSDEMKNLPRKILNELQKNMLEADKRLKSM